MFWGVVVVRWTGKLHLRLPYASQIGCLTAEWLPWLHVLLCMVVEANCIRQPVSLLFPHWEIREGGRNSKETTSLFVNTISLWYQHKPCNHSVVKTTLCFCGDTYMGSHWSPVKCKEDPHNSALEQNLLSGHSQVNSRRPATAFLWCEEYSEKIPKEPLKCFTNNKRWSRAHLAVSTEWVPCQTSEAAVVSHFTIGLYGPHRYVIM